MSNTHGPWRAPPREPPTDRRFLLWLALIAAGALAIWELWRLFPGALSTTSDQVWLVRGCIILGMLASGIAYAPRIGMRQTVRNVAIWGGIVAVLVFGYVFYQRFEDAALDARSEFAPGYPVSTGDGRVVLSENSDGDFSAIGKVNGATVEFAIDTGASDIVLAPGDAERAGIDLASLHFNRVYETANGQGRGASATLDKLEIGPIVLRDVPVSVNATPMRTSLLGMSFLKRMKSFEMRGRKLTLRYR
ncbi:MAG TPA: TIGR02281 family clan AA aspartic protease [Rhizomicrobium sp.]|nr:TIGR02281 family clan AA aspartic protease [Rhizomicrobium sp.]